MVRRDTCLWFRVRASSSGARPFSRGRITRLCASRMWSKKEIRVPTSITCRRHRSASTGVREHADTLSSKKSLRGIVLNHEHGHSFFVSGDRLGPCIAHPPRTAVTHAGVEYLAVCSCLTNETAIGELWRRCTGHVRAGIVLAFGDQVEHLDVYPMQGRSIETLRTLPPRR